MVYCFVKLVMLNGSIECWCRVAWVRISHSMNDVFHLLHIIDIGQIKGPIQYFVAMCIVVEWSDFFANGSRDKWR